MSLSKCKNKTRRRRAPLLLLPLALAVLPGCETLNGAAKGTAVPGEVSKFAAAVPRVENYAGSPCWQQVQIAKADAFLETAAKGGKEVVREVHPKCASEVEKDDKKES